MSDYIETKTILWVPVRLDSANNDKTLKPNQYNN